MIQIKNKKEKYGNLITIRKAAFLRRSFSMDSNTYEKQMNLTKQIIHRREKIRTVFIKQLKNSVMKSGRRGI